MIIFKIFKTMIYLNPGHETSMENISSKSLKCSRMQLSNDVTKMAKY